MAAAVEARWLKGHASYDSPAVVLFGTIGFWLTMLRSFFALCKCESTVIRMNVTERSIAY